MLNAREETNEGQLEINLTQLHCELDWLTEVINQVICSYLKQDGKDRHWQDIPLPDLSGKNNIYATLVNEWQLNSFERLALALTMAPHLRPELLDIFFGINAIYNRAFSEFGGSTNKTASGFLPTGQTLSFLICANNPLWRGKLLAIFEPTNQLMAKQVIVLDSVDSNQPNMSGLLYLPDQWLHYFVTGEKVMPKLSVDFPAHPITTQLDWTDLVLEDPVMSQIQQIKTWLMHGDTLMKDWGLAKNVKPGYRALFYGPSGTGKTLSASLLAKSTDREIYRVDLSMIVSKFIGETEKHLARVFDAASHNNWILFFDEADSLFGKRTAATSSNDRHANQQNAYLLQRIEDFSGVVILATNLKANLDEAFTRRFQAVIHFTLPTANQRLQLWKNAFSGGCELDDDVDLQKLAQDYELTGGAIIKIVRFSAMSAISRGSRRISHKEILEGIRSELRKDNKTLG